MKLLHVAVAVIRDAQGRILIAQRAQHQHQGGLWEFPGGKVEAGETLAQALGRELEEELGIQVKVAQPLIQIPFHYPDRHVLLDVWQVLSFSGSPQGREGQPIRWVSPDQLNTYAFPAANRPIVTAVQLPQHLLITHSDVERVPEQVQKALQQGVRWVILRGHQLSDAEYRDLYQVLLPRCQAVGACLAVNHSLQMAESLCAEAWHLTSWRLAELTQSAQFSGRWISASCHSPEELQLAQARGCHFALLSPVAATASHPDTSPLGWPTFQRWVAEAQLPVYALGGMRLQDCEQAQLAGAQGIAAISAWR